MHYWLLYHALSTIGNDENALKLLDNYLIYASNIHDFWKFFGLSELMFFLFSELNTTEKMPKIDLKI